MTIVRLVAKIFPVCIAGLTSVMRLWGPASLIDHKGVEVVEAGVSIDNLGCLGLANI